MISRVYCSHWYSFYYVYLCVMYVCMCVCAYIFIYIYVCIMHKRTSRYNSSGREKWVVFIDIGRQSTTTRIRKLEYLYFCLTLVPIYFHPIYFHSLQPHPRLCLYPIPSSRNILMLETEDFGCLFLVPFLLFSFVK